MDMVLLYVKFPSVSCWESLCVVKARQVFLVFQGSPEETTARPGCRREVWPTCTALGQSGVRTRPFSPTLPVMDRRALFRMASEKDSCARRHKEEAETTD